MKSKLGFVLAGITFFIASCINVDPPPEPKEPISTIISNTGCKELFDTNNTKRAGKDDCIEYLYDGSNTLTITHTNAAFNCCPGNLTVNTTISNGVIMIEENETEASCFCNCLYDLSYKIINIQPGNYTIKVIEPYIGSNAVKLEFSANLNNSASGKHCVNRTTYPWGI